MKPGHRHPAARGLRVGLLLALLAGPSAEALEHPVRPRPQCAQAPGADEPRRSRLPPACLGPLQGARSAPRHHAGRQQWRMRDCQAQARRQALLGDARAEFMRHCLHRGR